MVYLRGKYYSLGKIAVPCSAACLNLDLIASAEASDFLSSNIKSIGRMFGLEIVFSCSFLLADA